MTTAVRLAHIEFQLRRTAGILGVIQGLAWIVMSLICIGMYIKGTYIPDMNSYMDAVGAMMYMIFLARQAEVPFSQSLRPPVFFGFMWAYLVLNIVWLVTSVRILDRKNQDLQLAKRIKLWAEVTFLISLLDVLTVIILGSDYSKCMSARYYVSDEGCANGILPVLVIAAKGFVLWFINVIFAQYLYNTSRRLRMGQVYFSTTLTSPTVVQPPHGIQNYPNSPTANWQPAGSPYPQYQQQMSYPRN